MRISVKSKLFFSMIILLSVIFETSTTSNPDNHHTINSYFEKLTTGFDLVDCTFENSYISRFVLPPFRNDSSTNFSHEEFKSNILKKYKEIFGNKKIKLVNLNNYCNRVIDIPKTADVKCESKMIIGYDIDIQIYSYVNSLTITKKQKAKFFINNNYTFEKFSSDKYINIFENFYQSWYNYERYVPQHYLVFDIDDLDINDIIFCQGIRKIYSKTDFYNDRSSILFYHKSKVSMKIFNEISEDLEKYCFVNGICFYFSIYKYEIENFKKNNTYLQKSNGILTPMYIHYKEIDIEFPKNNHIFQKFSHQSDCIIKKISLNINRFIHTLTIIIKELSISFNIKIAPEINKMPKTDYILEFSLEKKDFANNLTCLASRKIFDNINHQIPFFDRFSVKSENGKKIDLCIDENNYKNFEGIWFYFEKFLKIIEMEAI